MRKYEARFWRRTPANSEFLSLAFAAISILLLSSQSNSKELKAPVFLEQISNETVAAGRDVRLACVVDHLGSYKLAWIQQDRSAILTVGKHVITRNPRIGVMHDEHRTWYLIIRKVNPGDAGTYMCQINTEPVTSQIGVVNVVVPPYIKDEMTSKDVRLQEGSSVNLACSSRGSPIPTVKWKREDGRPIRINSTKTVEEVSGPILHLTHLERSDMGAYLCIASNGVPPSVSKRIQVQVKFRPSVYAPHQLFGVIIGQDATLKCYVEAWPLGLNYWIRPKGLEIHHSDDKYNVTTEPGSQPYKTRMILNIKNFSIDDVGDYNCISNNSQGGAEQVIRVSASTTIITNSNLIEKTDHNNAKDPPLSSGKPVLKPDNWSKERDFDEKERLFNWKKDQIIEPIIPNGKDHSRGNSFFPLNTIEEAQESSSASTLAPFYYGQDSLETTFELLAFLVSRIGTSFYVDEVDRSLNITQDNDLPVKSEDDIHLKYEFKCKRSQHVKPKFIPYGKEHKCSQCLHHNFSESVPSRPMQSATQKTHSRSKILEDIKYRRYFKRKHPPNQILFSVRSFMKKSLTELTGKGPSVLLWWIFLRILINSTTIFKG
ncbi:UNVERIFIED_CONTAM: hypothetical protein RMT77_010809 [Armadillidium vulgare]